MEDGRLKGGLRDVRVFVIRRSNFRGLNIGVNLHSERSRI